MLACFLGKLGGGVEDLLVVEASSSSSRTLRTNSNTHLEALSAAGFFSSTAKRSLFLLACLVGKRGGAT